MRNTTHELIGVSLAVAAATAAESGPAETFAVAAAACYGSWLPDVDRLDSRVHRRTCLERRSVLVGAVSAVLRLPMRVIGLLVPHRAVTHSALACLAAIGCVALLLLPLDASVATVLAGGLGIGYAAHLLADGCTPAGVQLWWPVTHRRVWVLPRGYRIRTGSVREFLLAACVAALAVAVVVL